MYPHEGAEKCREFSVENME